MMKNMKECQIIRLKGTEERLYKTVAPLTMSPEVLRKNNNYPFKTTEDFVWFVAIHGQKVIGFIPVEKRTNYVLINNYYVPDKEEETLKMLLKAVLADFLEREISAVVLSNDCELFSACGFVVEKKWKLYVKMKRQ